MPTAVRAVYVPVDSSPTAMTIRVGAAVSAAASGRWSVTGHEFFDSSGSSRLPSSSVGRPNVAGSGSGWAK